MFEILTQHYREFIERIRARTAAQRETNQDVVELQSLDQKQQEKNQAPEEKKLSTITKRHFPHKKEILKIVKLVLLGHFPKIADHALANPKACIKLFSLLYAKELEGFWHLQLTHQHGYKSFKEHKTMVKWKNIHPLSQLFGAYYFQQSRLCDQTCSRFETALQHAAEGSTEKAWQHFLDAPFKTPELTTAFEKLTDAKSAEAVKTQAKHTVDNAILREEKRSEHFLRNARHWSMHASMVFMTRWIMKSHSDSLAGKTIQAKRFKKQEAELRRMLAHFPCILTFYIAAQFYCAAAEYFRSHYSDTVIVENQALEPDAFKENFGPLYRACDKTKKRDELLYTSVVYKEAFSLLFDTYQSHAGKYRFTEESDSPHEGFFSNAGKLKRDVTFFSNNFIKNRLLQAKKEGAVIASGYSLPLLK